MRDYGKVHSKFWSSPTISPLSDDGRLLALYVMTSPHTTIAGVFRLPDGYATEDLKWASQRVAKGFEELFAKGFANRCETTKWVWILKHLEWNPPENPNQRKAALKCAQQIPDDCAWKAAFYKDIGRDLGMDEPASIVNGSETVNKPFLNQKQEQEQEQEQEQKKDKTLSAAPTSPDVPRGTSESRIDQARRVFEYWKQRCKHPQAILDSKREKAITGRLKDGYTADHLMLAVEGCLHSPHHQGENDRATVYDDIELICRDGKHVDQFLKIATGRKHDGPGPAFGAAGRKSVSAAQRWLESAPPVAPEEVPHA